MDIPNVEWQWNQLLDYVESDLVVPIVGRELLWTDIRGERQYVPAYVARQLAARAGMEWTDDLGGDPVSAVVQRYLGRGKGRNWPYTALAQLARELESTDPPVPLLQLAAIPFRLFVSTTWDRYLERAVNTVRFGGADAGTGLIQTVVPPYGLGSKADLSERGGDRPVTVFPLLGRANTSPDFAVTDEDVLEFVHQFQVTGTPRLLLETLRQSHLLLIGSCFSDWLARFMIRVVRPNRLWTSTSSQLTHFVADRAVMNDARLLTFLQHPLTDTEVFPISQTDEFVQELHRRWTARHPALPSTSPIAPPTRPAQGAVAAGGVFLSYVSEDYDAAARVYEALDRGGVDVWFDKRDLHAGDEFKRKIAGQIARSYFFVPVVSKHSLTTEPRFFRFEWREAEQRAKFFPFDVPYVMPLAIDDATADDEGFPEFVTKVHWTHAPSGRVPADFVEDLVRAYRRVQRPPTRS